MQFEMEALWNMHGNSSKLLHFRVILMASNRFVKWCVTVAYRSTSLVIFALSVIKAPFKENTAGKPMKIPDSA
jgi:hypothetical protein